MIRFVYLKEFLKKVRRDFECITTWKYLYISTSDELVNLGIDEKVFPNEPLIVLTESIMNILSFCAIDLESLENMNY